jgi:hypothetical protein
VRDVDGLTVWFRLLATTGEILDEGSATAELAGGALVVSPDFGTVLRVPPADILEIGEPEPYVIRLALADGPVLELSRLGAIRTQLLAELRDARAGAVAGALLLDGVGQPETFAGTVAGVDAELRLYDDALVVLPVRGAAAQVPYPFIRGVHTDPSGYRIRVDVAGEPALEIHQLARRTTEFVGLLTSRCRAASGRTAAFLGVLLPGLGPIALRSVAALLRDGLAGARTDLDAVDPTVWPALTAAVTLPERVANLHAIERLGPVRLGFKQIRSVRRPAVGVRPWRDPASPPGPIDHDGHAGSFGSGLAGVAGARLVSALPLGFDGPFDVMGAALAYGVLGVDGSRAGSRAGMLPRADVRRGRLIPESTDLAALSATDIEPTVLAFVLCLTDSGTLVYEVLNATGPATYLFRAPDTATLVSLNRALDLVGFRVEGIPADADSAGSPYRAATRRAPALQLLRAAFTGRVEHTDDWPSRLSRLLSDPSSTVD